MRKYISTLVALLLTSFYLCGNAFAADGCADVDGDGSVSPLDVLALNNHINSGSTEYISSYDVDGDGMISALDVLNVTNHLNSGTSGNCNTQGPRNLRAGKIGSPEDLGSGAAPPSTPSTPPPVSPSPRPSIVPSLSPSPSQSPSPIPSASPSQSPSPIPSPTPMQPTGENEDCLFAAGWAGISGYFGHADNVNLNHEFLFNSLNVTRGKPLPSCLSQKLAARCGCGEGTSNTGNHGNGQNSLNFGQCNYQGKIKQDASVKIWGACYFKIGFGNIWASNTNIADSEQRAMAAYLGVETLGFTDPYGGPILKWGTSYKTNQNGEKVYYWLFDKNCNHVPFNFGKQICGYAGTAISPISLILDNKIGLHEDMQVVEFNLTGREGQGFVLWKASSSAPLLVYDPKNTGKVKDAKQLFGNFALGGVTSQVSDFSKSGFREPWKNGYEALKLLDTDNDGVLKDVELAGLKLWSDKNRNGISESGEVQSLSDFKITKIFYKNPTPVKDSKDVELEVGYERIVDGKAVFGKSIDWYSETFSSKTEATSALMGIFSAPQKDSSELKKDISINEIPETDKRYKGKSLDPRKNISGTWVWTILEKNADKNPGLFVFHEKLDGTFTGHTVAEAILAENSDNARTVMFAIPGEGSIKRIQGKGATLQLVFRDDTAGGIVESTGHLSEDGTVIKGTAKQSYQTKDGDNVKSASVTYNWIATKFSEEKE